MKTECTRSRLACRKMPISCLLAYLLLCFLRAFAENIPPTVSIVWPPSNTLFTVFGGGAVTKIKVETTDPDGSVGRVMFYYDETNLMGVGTSPPFNLLWRVDQPCPGGCTVHNYQIKAVATDNAGAQSESAPVRLFVSDTRPLSPVLEIIAPTNGTIIPASKAFTFSAEFLTTHGEVGPVEFFDGTNSLGVSGETGILTAGTPPVSITVTNLAEGNHNLSVRYVWDPTYCTCNWTSKTVRVVALKMQNPRAALDGGFQFEVHTPYLGSPNIIETSSNLFDWFPLETNRPAKTAFTITDPSNGSRSNYFYRVLAPQP